jgi:hypothetical protein
MGNQMLQGIAGNAEVVEHSPLDGSAFRLLHNVLDRPKVIS